MGSVLTSVHDVVAGPCGLSVASLVTDASEVGTTPVRCPVTDRDGARRRRLDLALRMLPGQAASQWCREAGDGTAVIRSWPLPACAVTLYDEAGSVLGMLLATGRPSGGADVWRFRFDVTAPVVDRARRLLPT